MNEKQYYKEKGVSNSSLNWFLYSPAYFRKRLDEEIAEEQKSWQSIGRKVHMAILEPEEFEKNYIYLEYQQPKSPQQKQFCEEYVKDRRNRPKATKISSKIKAYGKAYNTKAIKEEDVKKKAESLQRKLKDYINYLEKSKEYKDILTKAEWNLINRLKEAVFEHKIATEVLGMGGSNELFKSQISAYSELPIFWKYPTDIDVDCKSMVDRLVIDKENKTIKLIDLKTTSNIGKFSDSFNDYSYYRQLAFYWLAVYYMAKNDSSIPDIRDYKKETYIIALQKRDIPECRVYKIPEHKLNEGLAEIERILPEIAWHIENDKWFHTKEYYTGNGIEKLFKHDEQHANVK